MIEKTFFFEMFLFEKIKVYTVDSATFYTNPTKTSLQKTCSKNTFFRHKIKRIWLNRSGSKDHADPKNPKIKRDNTSVV